MDYRINDRKCKIIEDKFKELEDLLTDRISDFHEVKGMMQARHAYIYYRSLLVDIKRSFYESIEELKREENEN